MRFKLPSLQYFFAATIRATLILFILSICNSRFASADVTPWIQNIIFDEGSGSLPQGYNGLEIRSPDEEGGKGMLDIIPRAADKSSLGNNQFKTGTIKIGETQWYYFPKKELDSPPSTVSPGIFGNTDIEMRNELRRRDGMTTVYISLTTCSQPSVIAQSDGTFTPPPPLQVYISTSEKNQKPGPGEVSEQDMYFADGGYINAAPVASGDVYIGVAAPNMTDHKGDYSYQVAASIDDYFHQADDAVPFMFFIDSDKSHALFMTQNLTQSEPGSENYQQWMDLNPPFTMFANEAKDSSVLGLEWSYCALDQHAQIGKGNKEIEVGMTSRGLGNKPKQQFYLSGLNSSSRYYGSLAMDGNSTSSGIGVVGGGGKVWRPVTFDTKADENCAVLFNFTFCSDVAYAVPSNPSKNLSTLRHIYDSNAEAIYQNFTYSLQQIQCNASTDSMFSLAVNCTDCEQAYKEWLCAVTIPRCDDFSSNAWYLQPRNTAQKFLNGSEIPKTDPLRQSPANIQTRNPKIADQIQPGPYKEILPCQDICWNLVRSCPAQFKFQCPKGQWLNKSYGVRDRNGVVTCSYPGAAYHLNDSWRVQSTLWVLYVIGIFWGTYWVLD